MKKIDPETIVKSLNVPNTISEKDYVGDDGLIYCHKCHTRKQSKQHFLGRDWSMPIMCECERAEFEKQEAIEERREFERKIDRNKRACFPTSMYEEWTFANDDGSNQRISSAMQRYVANFSDFRDSGKGLLLYGAVGTGKTFYAAAIANALLAQGYKVLFTSLARLGNRIQSTFNGKQDIIDSLCDYNLIILDDIKTERDTPTMNEHVYQVINTIYQSGIPMICTTNVSIEEIKNPGSKDQSRIYDRILERCHPVEVSGENRRKTKVIDDYRHTRDLLGL